jgi:thymidylate kinase
MAFILIEGLDRSGKTSVANKFKEDGFKIVHMSAPDKKYYEEGYSGESYFEEIVRMYDKYQGQDVVFDRTPYGEYVWSNVYNRASLLSEEDFEYLSQLEENNEVVKVLMYDENKEAHWQRCVADNEPLDRRQFIQANRLYDDLVRKYGFQRRQLKDFELVPTESDGDKTDEDGITIENGGNINTSESKPKSEPKNTDVQHISDVASLEYKIERANAIRVLLQTKIVKKKDDVYRSLEQDIKTFLNKELENIFKDKNEETFTSDEVQILKLYVQRIKEKIG